METVDINQYLIMIKKRRYWILIPFLIVVLVTLAYVRYAPKIYETQTLILVQSRKVPENFVREIVTNNAESRLMTITQQVTSRTNLEKIINKYQLLGADNKMPLDAKVMSLRKNIVIDVSGGGRRMGASAFSITFRGNDPQKVMQVTNNLASNFISENLKIRESQAMGTSVFLNDELNSVKSRLLEKEAQLKQYRTRYMGGLPEQLVPNLRILERLQGQIDQLYNSLRDAENRKLLIKKGAEDIRGDSFNALSSLSGQPDIPRDIDSLRNELVTLESRYTKEHPNVIRLKNMISKLEGDSKKRDSDVEGLDYRVDRITAGQLNDLSVEITGLKSEIKRLKVRIEWYQKKVEDTPKREQELLSIQRDYNNLQEQYNSLLNRKLEADIAVSMEKKQKGEQFRVIDSAKIPTIPVEPDIRKIILIGFALGLCMGFGMGYLREMMDTSFKTPEEIEKELKLPVLISMPINYSEAEIKRIKRKEFFTFSSVMIVFILAVIGLFYKYAFLKL